MGRSRSTALLAMASAAVVVLSGCGGSSPAGEPAPSDSAAATASPSPAWPDPALTIVTTPHGTREPVDLAAIEPGSAVEQIAAEEGVSLEEAARISKDQEVFSIFLYQVEERFYGQQYSTAAWRDPLTGDGPWVAFAGTVPEAVVPMAEALPFSIELRGGTLMSKVEHGAVLAAGLEAFRADVQPSQAGVGGGLDMTTGHFTIDYVPTGVKRADDATAAAMVAAAQQALGRDVAFTVDFNPDERDPLTTEPAVWFLPEGFVPDPAATSVEVLVDEQGCTSGRGAAGNTAEPVVEVTASQVRIAVSTYIRKGGQFCPGHPLAPLVVDLGQPLGDRTLVDVNGAIDDPPS